MNVIDYGTYMQIQRFIIVENIDLETWSFIFFSLCCCFRKAGGGGSYRSPYYRTPWINLMQVLIAAVSECLGILSFRKIEMVLLSLFTFFIWYGIRLFHVN